MAETEETFSDVVGFGSAELHDARSHMPQWNTFGPGEYAGPAFEEALWSAQAAADASPFTSRWVWKYGMNAARLIGKASAVIDYGAADRHAAREEKGSSCSAMVRLPTGSSRRFRTIHRMNASDTCINSASPRRLM
jgi:hypothetical protein